MELFLAFSQLLLSLHTSLPQNAKLLPNLVSLFSPFFFFKISPQKLQEKSKPSSHGNDNPVLLPIDNKPTFLLVCMISMNQLCFGKYRFNP